MLKALVISVSDKIDEVGSVLAVARDAARRRENTSLNPPIRALQFISELRIYVAIYELAEKSESKQKSGEKKNG